MFARKAAATFAGTALIAGALGLAGLTAAGTASAMSSADDTFLSDITSEGIAYDSPRAVLKAAHNVCSALDDGADPVDLGMEIMDSTDLTTSQAAMFVVSAVGNFCPEYGSLFDA